MRKQYDDVVRFDDYRALFKNSAAKFGDKAAFKVKSPDGTIGEVSYKELLDRYYRLTSFFLSKGYGGKPIAVAGRNCKDWFIAYLAAATAGVVVPLDKELNPEDIFDFMNSAECSVICTDNRDFIPEGAESYSFEDIDSISGGDFPIDAEAVDAIDIPKDKTQILLFTSGTTGNSKGVCLSQWNVCSDVWYSCRMIRFWPTDTSLSILPLHHTYECNLEHLVLLSCGTTIAYADSLAKITRNLTEYQPTILVVVPALLAFMDKRIRKTLAKEAPKKYRPLFETLTLSEALAKVPFYIRWIIKKKVRASLGGKLRVFIVGAADLDVSLVEDFNAIDIMALQGYGLTECSPLVAGNGDMDWNKKSTGPAIPGVDIMIHDPNEEGIGEIYTRGDNVMLGYYNDPEATAKVFDDGWFRTGDLGYIDDEGFLYIKGRIKSVIVTENGKNIYPEELETRLGDFDEIAESLVLPDTSKGETVVKAKIFPNKDAIAEKLGHEPSAKEISKTVQTAVDTVNDRMPAYKAIKIVQILDEELEKTTTQKVKRHGKNME